MQNYDVIVIGAGPGGSSAARFAARSGLKTLLIEKRPDIGSPVRCGEGISKGWMPECDLKPDSRWISNEVKGARIYGPSERKPVNLTPEIAGNVVGYVIERDKFDKDLASLAASEGAEIWVKSPATGVIMDGVRVAGAKVRHNGTTEEVRANMVIAADGFESEFGRWAGLESVILAKNDIISCLEYRMVGVDADLEYADFYLGSSAPAGYLWVFPKGEREANVGLGVALTAVKDRGEIRNYLNNWIRKHPGFSRGKTIQLISGGVSVSNVRDSFTLPGLVLVGDAGRLTDPLTGGGIANACVSGKMAAEVSKEAIESSDFSSEMMKKYERMVKDKFQKKHLRNWIAKEKLAALSDSQLEKLLEVLTGVEVKDVSVEAILQSVKGKYPEMLKDLEQFI